MDDQERKMQKAVGNEKTFRVKAKVTVSVPIEIVKELKAVSEKDACDRMKQLLDMLAHNALIRELLPQGGDPSIYRRPTIRRPDAEIDLANADYNSYEYDDSPMQGDTFDSSAPAGSAS